MTYSSDCSPAEKGLSAALNFMLKKDWGTCAFVHEQNGHIEATLYMPDRGLIDNEAVQWAETLLRHRVPSNKTFSVLRRDHIIP